MAITAAKLDALKVCGSDVNKNAIKNSKYNAVLNSVDKICISPQIPGKGKGEDKYFRKATEANYDGTEPTSTLLKNAKNHLKENGYLYLVIKTWMDYKKVIQYMKKSYKCKLI